ncbi:MAG: ATP-binding cassette domain-containing protein, partial [Clostridia bacterium]|nr:ATP-binding cassette domain-containing protein [Clostridia bacterium]
MEAKDLCLAYDGRMVLCEVDFHIDAGDYLCILGENGSGKSTLLKALLGLKAPTDGKIIYGA